MKSRSEGLNREMIHRSDFDRRSGVSLELVAEASLGGDAACGSGEGEGGGRIKHSTGPDRRIVIGSRHGIHQQIRESPANNCTPVKEL